MVDLSPGKKLSQARLAKRLTIDEAAHATKLRPDKIVALENDDFSRFGSIAYGKGFLQIYARYLDIDISDQLRGMELPDKTVSIGDYQYLNSGSIAKPSARSSADRRVDYRERRESNGRKAPSILPLLVVLGLGGAGIYAYYNLYANRMGLNHSNVPAAVSVQMAPMPPIPGAIAPGPAAPSPANPADAAPVAPSAGAALPAAPISDSAFLSAANPPPAAAVTRPGAPADDANGPVNELVVEPIRKTWVKIRKNSPDSPPIFEDYIYPGVRPLKLRGAKFFVEVRDQSAVQIRKNGSPIAYQAPGISIQ